MIQVFVFASIADKDLAYLTFYPDRLEQVGGFIWSKNKRNISKNISMSWEVALWQFSTMKLSLPIRL